MLISCESHKQQYGWTWYGGDAPTGKVTVDEINYARQDVACTLDLLNAAKQEFDYETDPIRSNQHAWNSKLNIRNSITHLARFLDLRTLLWAPLHPIEPGQSFALFVFLLGSDIGARVE